MSKRVLKSAATRKRIIASSRAEFRRHGIEGGSLAGIMSALGLTNGGFYRHFSSKAHLVSESISVAVDELVDHLAEASGNASPQRALEAAINAYLSRDHRDGDTGCPFAGLGSDLTRSNLSVRDQAVNGFERIIALLSTHIDERSPAGPRGQAMLALCAMMGALTVSRIARGNTLSEEVLVLVTNQLIDKKRARPNRSTVLSSIATYTDADSTGFFRRQEL